MTWFCYHCRRTDGGHNGDCFTQRVKIIHGPPVNHLPQAKHAAAIPSGYGKCVGMCEFQGQIVVACEGGVFRLDAGKLIPIPFAQAPQHTQD